LQIFPRYPLSPAQSVGERARVRGFKAN